jgi:hypothetical protein
MGILIISYFISLFATSQKHTIKKKLAKLWLKFSIRDSDAVPLLTWETPLAKHWRHKQTKSARTRTSFSTFFPCLNSIIFTFFRRYLSWLLWPVFDDDTSNISAFLYLHRRYCNIYFKRSNNIEIFIILLTAIIAFVTLQ